MEKKIFRLVHPEARRRAAQAIGQAPDGYVCTISEPKRNLEQNAKFHAMCGDVARQATWCGRRLAPYQWKTLFISGHSIASGHGVDIVVGIESEFANIREASSSMTKERFSSLIEYVYAWGAENGIVWSFSEDGQYAEDV